MGLKYEMPKLGETFSEDEIIRFAESESYHIKKTGDKENGEYLIVLSLDITAGMSFLLKDKSSSESFIRVY